MKNNRGLSAKLWYLQNKLTKIKLYYEQNDKTVALYLMLFLKVFTRIFVYSLSFLNKKNVLGNYTKYNFSIFLACT